MKRSTIAEIIAFPCTILFLYTGFAKIIDFDISQAQFSIAPIVSAAPGLAAVLLPSTEILTAVLLFLPKTRWIGFRAALLLMIVFTGYVIYILKQPGNQPCTCGGALEMLSWRQHLFLNSSFILLASLGIKCTDAKNQSPKMNTYKPPITI